MKFSRIPWIVILSSLGWSLQAQALDPIIRPYQSVRIAGMGGVRMTTGLYDENFFNNPARVTANPVSRFTIFQLTPFEITPPTLSAGSSIIAGTAPLTAASNAAGSNLHDRFQLILPAYYLAAVGDRKWSFAIGMITSIQTDADLRQSYQTEFGGYADVGLAATFGRKFLPDDSLSVGVTGHAIYRLGFNPTYSLIDYVRGTSLGLADMAGDGAMLDFDLGTTYRLTQLAEYEISVAAAMQNILGGTYQNLGLSLIKKGAAPAQPRSIGLGVSATRKDWSAFKNTVFALEVTDILNNGNGSFFRCVHLGGETHWKSLAFRLGLNQGYWTAGFGVDVGFFTLDLASYGEEMGLNAGTLEDRRYTLNFGFHI